MWYYTSKWWILCALKAEPSARGHICTYSQLQTFESGAHLPNLLTSQQVGRRARDVRTGNSLVRAISQCCLWRKISQLFLCLPLFVSLLTLFLPGGWQCNCHWSKICKDYMTYPIVSDQNLTIKYSALLRVIEYCDSFSYKVNFQRLLKISLLIISCGITRETVHYFFK